MHEGTVMNAVAAAKEEIAMLHVSYLSPLQK